MKFATYLLFKIENGRFPKENTEFVSTEQPTVEHIKPQNLSNPWIVDLGDNAEEKHDKYLNTLGNLSLVSRSKNSAISDESFISKKKFLKDEGSKFKTLNSFLLTLDKFDEKAINEREIALEKIVVKLYDIPSVDISNIRFDDSVEVVYNPEDCSIFTGSVPISFQLFGQEKTVQSYNEILFSVANWLLDKKPVVFDSLIKNKYRAWESRYPFITNNFKEDYQYSLLQGNVYLYKNSSVTSALFFAYDLIKKCGFDEELIIVLKKDTIKN